MVATGPAPPLLEELASEFRLGRVTGCGTLRVGSSNVLFHLTSASGDVVLRRLSRPPHRVAHQHALVRHLAQGGFPAIAPLESRTGTTWFSSGGVTYAVYPLVRGEHPEPGDAEAAAVAGHALARLHARTRDYSAAPPNPRPPMRERFLGSAARFDARVAGVLAEPSLEIIHGEARWLGGRVQRLAGELGDEAFGRLPGAVIHGDFNPENLLFRGGSLVAVLDFDVATRDARVSDLAVALHYLARPDGPGTLSVPATAALIRSYEDMAPLDEAERRALCLLVEVKSARSAMRTLRHVLKAVPHRRKSLAALLHRQLDTVRALDRDAAWRSVLLATDHAQRRGTST